MDNHILQWTVFPVKDEKKKTLWLLPLLGFLVVLVYLSFGNVFWVVFAMVLLVGSLSGFFTKTRYRFDSEGVDIKRTFHRVHKKWEYFRNFYVDENGIFLSPFKKPSRLENFRGIFVKFGDNREEVVSFVREKIKEVRDGGSKGV